MQLFYTKNIQGGTAFLGEEETRHCTKVLRKQKGAAVHFIDGAGGLYQGTITEFGKRDCQILIANKEQQEKWPGQLHIAIAPTKNISRMEWFVEKAVEIGVDRISFLLCEHSERKRIRLDRLEKVALSACKQSLKAYLPVLSDLIPYKEFIGGVRDNSAGKYLCWVNENTPHFLSHPRISEDCTILVGPEGDFSPTEISAALDAGFLATGLGGSRLRTETAGIVACQLFHVRQLARSLNANL